MAELTETRMNVAALKRVDPYVKSLLETAAHVALYKFNADNNEWEKTDIEGALFVYSRTGEPFHNILIMNRLSMQNLMEPVTQGLELQLQDPFLLYRNTKGLIYGIWFYDKQECVRIASSLEKLVKETVDDKNPEKKFRKKPDGNSGVDIFSMLTKAQEEYNSKTPKKILEKPSTKEKNTSKENDTTPQSVMDFFAKASSGSQFIHDKSKSQPPGFFIGPVRPGPPPGLGPQMPLSISSQVDMSRSPNILQRLMSNPAHTVEHIEKQQRSVTPQAELAALMKNKATRVNDSNKRSSNGFKLQSEPQDGVTGSQAMPSHSQLENGMGFLRISESSPTHIVQTQQFFNSGLTQQLSPTINDVLLDVNALEKRCLSAPQAGTMMETPTKPALMPPVMFTSSATKNEELSAGCVKTTPSVAPSVPAQHNTLSAILRQPEPLTKNQLLQAVSYLLKNDEEFLNKFHEAYLKSFSELVS